MMTTTKHLWAIGFDDMTRADQVRDKIVRIERDRNELILKDVVVVAHHPDGSLTIDRQPVAARLFLALHRGGLPHGRSAIRAARGARPCAHDGGR